MFVIQSYIVFAHLKDKLYQQKFCKAVKTEHPSCQKKGKSPCTSEQQNQETKVKQTIGERCYQHFEV